METIICYTDGGARGNPGPAAIGIYATDADGTVVLEHKETIGERTNNFAEYQAVITALSLLHERFPAVVKSGTVSFRLDSELVVKQILGQYRVKEFTLQPLHEQVMAKLKGFAQVSFSHVRRAQNKEADRLVNEALDVLG